MNDYEAVNDYLNHTYGKDVPMSLATADESEVAVRVVDCYYENGRLFLTSHSASKKARQIQINPQVALCKDLFQASGTAVNLGNPLRPENQGIRETLRRVFVSFYEKHVNEKDPGTCIIRIDLNWAVAFDKCHKYRIDFGRQTGEVIPFISDIVF